MSPTRTRNNRARRAACRCPNGRACAASDHSSDRRSANGTANGSSRGAPAFATTLHLDVVRGDGVTAAPDVNRVDLQKDAIATSRVRGSAQANDFKRRLRPAWDDNPAASVEQRTVNGRRDPHANPGGRGDNRMVHANVQHRPSRHDLGTSRVSGSGTDRHRQAD
jgi:hypothetical protein